MWYRSGTVSLTNGSTAVVGTGTSWIAGAAVGEGFIGPDGKTYEVANIASNTAITLGSAYQGSTASGQSYQIIPSQSYIRDLASQAATLISDYGTVLENAGTGKFGDGTVSAPGIRFTADENTGIRRVSADTMALVVNGSDKVTVTAAGVTGIVKGDVGLGNVDNTSNATERAATATLTNKTINLANNTLVATSAQLAAAITDESGSGGIVFANNPALTGTPTAPTATAGTNTTQLATTAFVTAADVAERTNAATLANKTLTSPTLSTEAIAVTTNNLPSIRPSLNLDFANSQTVDPRITFTRASTATRVGPKGLIESVASGVPRIDYDPITLACKGLLVEEARTNLLTYSQDFDNTTYWGVTGAVIESNAAVAPDGTVTADGLRNTAGATSLVSTSATVTASATNDYYVSVFVKKAATTSIVTLNAYYAGNGEDNVRFNLDTLAVTGTVPYAGEYIFQSYGNGWYRIGYRITRDATASKTSIQYRIWGADRANGVIGDNIFIWGAQLEAGAFPTSHIPSSVTFTGRSSTATFIGSNGLIQTAASGAARYSYNPLNLSVSPALLLEAATTNLLTYSGAVGGTGWTPGAVTVSLNNAMSPDGTTTATLASDVSTSDSPYIDQMISVPNDSSTYVLSMYVKANTAIQTSLVSYLVGGSTPFGTGAYCLYGWASGAYSKAFDAIDGGVIDVGNGWKRLYTVIKNNSTGNTTCVARLFVETSGLSATGSVYVWGAQLEVGSYPTSYIPTTTATVTRAADTSTSASTTRAADVATMTGTNFSSWWNATEGTLTAEFDCLTSNPTAYWRALSVNDGTSANETTILLNATSDKAYAAVVSGGVSGFDTGGAANGNVAVSANTPIRASLAYKLNDFACSMNGGTVQVDSSGNPSVGVYQLRIGNWTGGDQLNGHIRSLRYYPKRLASAELQALTV